MIFWIDTISFLISKSKKSEISIHPLPVSFDNYKGLVIFDSSVRVSFIWISISEFLLNFSKYSRNCCSPACNTCLSLKRCAMKKQICKENLSYPFKEARLFFTALWELFQNYSNLSYSRQYPLIFAVYSKQPLYVYDIKW